MLYNVFYWRIIALHGFCHAAVWVSRGRPMFRPSWTSLHSPSHPTPLGCHWYGAELCSNFPLSVLHMVMCIKWPSFKLTPTGFPRPPEASSVYTCSFVSRETGEACKQFSGQSGLYTLKLKERKNDGVKLDLKILMFHHWKG